MNQQLPKVAAPFFLAFSHTIAAKTREDDRYAAQPSRTATICSQSNRINAGSLSAEWQLATTNDGWQALQVVGRQPTQGQ